MMLGYLTYIYIRYVSASTAYGKSKHKGVTHTLALVGSHFPLSPFGPNIECLERVSSFGWGKFKDLQEESKQAKPIKQADESTYDSTSTYILVQKH